MRAWSSFVSPNPENCPYHKYSLSNPKSQCLDGSIAAYYYRNNSYDKSNSYDPTKWHIHFEGGGWCYNLDSCEHRSTKALGSSLLYPNCISDNYFDAGYFSSNKTLNSPLYHHNVVYVRYCDGSSFAGNSIRTYNGKKLYFQGKRIRKNLLDDLWNLRGMNQATEIVFSGSSAGGLAVYLGIDDLQYYIRHHLQTNSNHIRIIGMPDSGFFLNYNSPYRSIGSNEVNIHPSGPRYQFIDKKWFTDEYDPHSHRNIYGSLMQDVFDFTGIANPLDNKSHYHQSPPLYDTWVVLHVLGTPFHKNENEIEIINQYGQLVKDTLFKSLPPTSPHGIFLDSCFHHTFVNWRSADFLKIFDSNGLSIPTALSQWNEQNPSPSPGVVYYQEARYPCEECCLQPSTPNNPQTKSNSLSIFQSSSSSNSREQEGSYLQLVGILLVIVITFFVLFRLIRRKRN